MLRAVLSSLLALLATPVLGPFAAPALAAEYPSVTRPQFMLGGRALGNGTAFLLAAPDEAGAVAVAAAHNFMLEELSLAQEVEFRLGRSGKTIARSSRLWAEPGRAFSEPGATYRDDVIVFALDAVPFGVEPLLPAARRERRQGRRVRILGVPAASPQDEAQVFGTVYSVSVTSIEVDLDVPQDLRGWGGAPVLLEPEGGVIGVLEAAYPEDGRLRLGVAPIEAVQEALSKPLDGGLGRPFAEFAGLARERAKATTRPAAGEPQLWRIDPDTGSISREAAAPRGSGDPDADDLGRDRAAPAGEANAPAGDAQSDPDDKAGDPAYAVSARRAPIQPEPGKTLLGESGEVETKISLSIETPAAGEIVGGDAGAFVAGRGVATKGHVQTFDVMLVVDTSGSTSAMTGSDINANGMVGRGGLSGVFGRYDPGDSVLAAEISAALRMLEGLDPRHTRVGLITFAGMPVPSRGTIVIGGGSRRPDVLVEQPLTSDFARIRAALAHVLERGPAGATNMAGAIDTAYVELYGLRGARSVENTESDKVVLFFTDGQPTLPYFDDPYHPNPFQTEAANVDAVLRAANRAAKLGLEIHSFAIGPEALDGPIAVVEMARRTGGFFTPVRDPGDLVRVVENINLAKIDRYEIRNLDTEEDATQQLARADGQFAALVPLRVGKNRIEVKAVASDGTEQSEVVEIAYAPDAPRVELPRELIAQRNELLEQRLVEIRRARVGIERERVERTRKELLVEIERERQAAQARADQQRKELDIEPETPKAEPSREPTPAPAG